MPALTDSPYHLENAREFLVEASPCDGCWHAGRCSAELLACKAFSLYMAGESPRRWKLIPRQPSRDR